MTLAQQVKRNWMRQLSSTGTRRAASHPPLVAEATERLGPNAVRWAVDLGASMATEITEQMPDFAGGDEAFETLRMGTESATMHALLVVAADDHTLARLTEEGLEGDRNFVRRGIRLDLVLRGVRIGHALMTRELLKATSTLVEEGNRVAEMERISELLFSFIDVYSSRMAEEYLAEHDRWVTSAAAERAEMVRRLLDGPPPPLAEASRVLGYQVERHHVAMVLWQPAGAEQSPTDLQRAAARILKDLGCTASLEVPHATSSLWVWGSWRSRDASSGASDIQPPDSIHVALGTVTTGASGFRQSHLEAIRVAELVRSNPLGRPATLTRYHDVELAVLLAQDLDRAKTFVVRELGPAAAATTAAAELRDTVAAYLRHDRSLVRAAAELHVARNTVAYRVKKFQELSGRDVAERRLELEAALRLVAVLNGQVTLETP